MKSLSYLLRLLPILLFIFACQSSEQQKEKPTDAETSQLGDVDFKVTGAPAAQATFEKGLLLLHSFEYEDARAEFLKVQEIDSTFAMAYWGEAMTHNHSLWQRQEKEKATAAIEKLGADSATRLAMFKTEIEKDFYKAIEILFRDSTKYDNDIAYKDYMKSLTEKYPENHEVSAFYAISLLGSSRNGRDEELYGKSARIAQGILKENPQHPGALHYLIHSYDDPGHAHLAKTAADSYSKTAPDAAHALHMPSHIYVAMGNWDDVVSCNIASWNASYKRMERKELDTDALSFHALNWLQYGFLQRGETEAAAKLLEAMQEYEAINSTKPAKSYLVAMKGAQLVETNSWEGAAADIPVKAAELNLVKRTGHAFLEGMIAYHKKDAEGLAAVIKDIELDRNAEMLQVGEKGFSMCSTSGYANKPSSQLDIDMAHIMEMELEAYHAHLKNAPELCSKKFEEAIALDESLSYSYGPPAILKPVAEAYGEWLLEQNKPGLALTTFEKSLKRHPRRLRSLKGKKQAAELLKQADVIAEADKELQKSVAKKEWDVIM